MKGRLHGFSVDMTTGKQLVTFEIDSDFREGYDRLSGDDLEIRVQKWRNHRSNDANAYFHVLVNAIAMNRGLPDADVKRRLIEDYGVVDRDEHGPLGFMSAPGVDPHRVAQYVRLYKQTVKDGKTYNCYLLLKPSHLMDSAEMSRLIEGAIYEAKQLGIDTDTPEQRMRFLRIGERS
jgi:hypothetical protein